MDQTTGNVLVVDGANGSVDQFDSEGNPLPFEAVQPYISGNELTGGPGEAFNFGGFGQAAVDSSEGPTSGYIYVSDTLNSRVAVFASDGNFVGEVDSAVTSPEKGGTPCGLAVDPSGAVVVAYTGGHIDWYMPVDGVPAHNSFVRQVASQESSCNISVDGAGDVYAIDQGSFEVLKYDSAGQRSVAAPFGSAVAVNTLDNHLFVVELFKITEYGVSGSPVGDPFGSLAFSLGVAVNGTNGKLYATDGGATNVSVFQTGIAGPPSIDNVDVLNVTTTSAEVRVKINPHLTPTQYYVEYGTDTFYDEGTLPSSKGASIGEGGVQQTVRVAISDLRPGVTYHFRVVASSGLGTTQSDDHILTAFPPGLAGLPDSRVWEKVSPLDKNGGEIPVLNKLGNGGIIESSVDGNALTYDSSIAFAHPLGAPGISQYLSNRTSHGWSTQNITAPTDPQEYALVGGGGPYKAFSDTLSKSLLYLGKLSSVPDEPAGYRDYRVRDNDSGAYRPLLTTLPKEAGEMIISPNAFDLQLVAATPDLEHVVVSTAAALTPGATYKEANRSNWYEWADGELEPVSVLPGVSDGGTVPTSGAQSQSNIVSDDGSRVFWESEIVGSRALYVRDGIGGADVKTVELDVTHGTGASGKGEFLAASSNGSRAFFIDEERLTPDSTAGGSGAAVDLYEYDLTNSELNDLTVDENPADTTGAGVQGVAGVSEDGSFVYFVATGALPQAEMNANGTLPVSGANNLYLSREGHLTFITALAGNDEIGGIGGVHDWSRNLYYRTTRVSDDGTKLVFVSERALTDYDNSGFREVYLYDANTKELVCVSCNSSGEPPRGPAMIPGGTGVQITQAIYQSRVLSGDGSRVFFNTIDPLVPQDTNGRQDVYEYENGRARLISGGSGNNDSSFVDASKKGDDVFFVTGQQLTREDTDELADVYDARTNGEPFAEPVRVSCSGAGCQGLPSVPPIFATPSSITFSGIGNYVSPGKQAKRKPLRKKSKAKSTHKRKATSHHRKSTAGSHSASHSKTPKRGK